MPADLAAKVNKLIAEKPEITWHHAVRLIVDPDYTPDDDDDEEEEEEEEEEEVTE